MLSYENQWKQYRFRLTEKDLISENSIEIIKHFAEKAKAEYRS